MYPSTFTNHLLTAIRCCGFEGSTWMSDSEKSFTRSDGFETFWVGNGPNSSPVVAAPTQGVAPPSGYPCDGDRLPWYSTSGV